MRRKRRVRLPMHETPLKHYLLASDFDQTLSFNDSGLVLSELLGISGFEDRVAGLASSNLVQQGGELAYLIRHDPEFRGVRREHLVEAGRRVRLKSAIPALMDFMTRGTAGYGFLFSSYPPRRVKSSSRRWQAWCLLSTSTARSWSSIPVQVKFVPSSAYRPATARSRSSKSSSTGWASPPIA